MGCFITHRENAYASVEVAENRHKNKNDPECHFFLVLRLIPIIVIGTFFNDSFGPFVLEEEIAAD